MSIFNFTEFISNSTATIFNIILTTNQKWKKCQNVQKIFGIELLLTCSVGNGVFIFHFYKI